jgi:hypothetical protein
VAFNHAIYDGTDYESAADVVPRLRREDLDGYSDFELLTYKPTFDRLYFGTTDDFEMPDIDIPKFEYPEYSAQIDEINDLISASIERMRSQLHHDV